MSIFQNDNISILACPESGSGVTPQKDFLMKDSYVMGIF
jgi:hypothetical protein